MNQPRDENLFELEKVFDISRHSDLDDVDADRTFLERAFARATQSEHPVRFEIKQAKTNQLQIPFLPADAACYEPFPLPER